MDAGSPLLRYAFPTAFFSACFLYVLLVVEPTLIYHSLGESIHYPPFRTSWQFFAESFRTCGGPVEYLAALISHLFYLNWVGALIYTAIGFFLWWSTRSILGISRIRHVGFVSYLPIVALLVLCTGYNHQPLIILSTVLGVLFFAAYMKWVPERALWASVLLATLSGGLFYLTVNGCILFWSMVVLYELILRKRFVVAGLAVAIGVAVCLAPSFLFDVDMYPLRWKQGRTIIKPETYPLFMLYGLYFFFPLLLIINSLLAGKPEKSRSHPKKTRRKNIQTRAPRPWQSPVIQAIVLAIVCVVMLKPAFDFKKKKSRKIRAFAQSRQWPQLLDYARKNSFSKNMYIIDLHDIMLALYHTDALGENLFDWPVGLKSLIIPNNLGELHRDLIIRRSNLVLELGCMGLCEKITYEALINCGEQAIIVENLAIINMVKGDIQTARVFLNVLKKDINHSGRGGYWLDILAADPGLLGNDRINYLRSLALYKDSGGLELSLNYDQLLKRNPENKAAREFMMCQYLLTGQLKAFVANLDRYKTFDAGKLPRCYDQALALYRILGGKESCTWEPSANSYDQGKKFLNILNQCKGDKRKLYYLTKQEFGDSYYFYFYLRKEMAGKL